MKPVEPLGESGPRLRAMSILTGVAVAYALSLTAAALMGLAMFRVRIPDPTVTLLMSVVSYLSMMGGGVVAGRRAGTLGWLHGGLTGLGYVAIALVLTGTLFHGITGLGSTAGRLVAGFVLGAVGGTVGVNLD